MFIAACLGFLLALGLAEQLALRRARRAVPIRIHVNGTRGKSTVTRLIAAALREAGIPTIAKVTGTAPRLVLADGSERAIRRWAPANIREQAWLVRRARRAGARAMVAECMAIRPDLQQVSERAMVRATIGVITNVRRDHTEVMGRSLDEIARSLAATVPHHGVLITGAGEFAELFADRCRALGTRLVAVETRPGLVCENVGTALAVTRELGIADAVALAGMEKAAPDAGAATTGTCAIDGREIRWLDATAANDPESLDLLMQTGLKPCSTTSVSEGAAGPQDKEAPALQGEGAAASQGGHVVAQSFSPVLMVYNHRADRPERLRTFAEHSAVFRGAATIFITGERPPLSVTRFVRAACRANEIRFVPRRRLADALRTRVRATGCARLVPLASARQASHSTSRPPSRLAPFLAGSRFDEAGTSHPAPRTPHLVVFCGNTRGFENPLRADQFADRTGHA